MFFGQKSSFRHYCIQTIRDGIHIRVYKISDISNFSQFISVKVKNRLRKSQTQFEEKLRKLRLRRNDGSLIKKSCIENHSELAYNFSVTEKDCITMILQKKIDGNI